jgi:hypothetical protein
MLNSKKTMLLFLTVFILTPGTFAAHDVSSVRVFRVYSFKSLTPHVDRLFHADGGAFADMFCREDAAEAMFVDSRVPALDGKVFRFESVQACEDAKVTIHRTYRKCVTELQLNTVSMSATVQVSHCR